jgi:feruloyl esterase
MTKMQVRWPWGRLWHERAIAAIAAIATVVALVVPERVLAQSNGSSFTDLASLGRLLKVAAQRPVMRCRELVATGAPSYTVLTAEPAGGPGVAGSVCRVHGAVPLELEFMLELPNPWNGRLYVLGNGGYAGESVTGDYGMAERTRAMAVGFAVMFTNLGHDRVREPGTDWARNSFAKKLDYAVRGLHTTTTIAKDIARLYYGRRVQRSYFDGCSTGGGQALKAAQRFPADYDGIVGGAPVFDFVQLQLYGWNNQMAVLNTPLSREKVALLGQRIMDLFDAQDGVKDGVIENPLAIDFDPVRDLPHAGPLGPGFTDAELSALSRIYRGTFLDGRQLAPGVPVGAESLGQVYATADFGFAPPESGWATRLVPDRQGHMQQRANVEGWLKYLAFEQDDPDMDITRFDPGRDLPRMQVMSSIMDAADPDLGDFKARGGKMILYHGWADVGVNPIMTVRYYEKIQRTMGKGVDRFVRLFMVPGMFHCRGGLNVDRFDAAATVIAWVERGEVPERIIGTRIEDGKVVRTRPLCPYPQVARYKGIGGTDNASSFSCELSGP